MEITDNFFHYHVPSVRESLVGADTETSAGEEKGGKKLSHVRFHLYVLLISKNIRMRSNDNTLFFFFSIFVRLYRTRVKKNIVEGRRKIMRDSYENYVTYGFSKKGTFRTRLN